MNKSDKEKCTKLGLFNLSLLSASSSKWANAIITNLEGLLTEYSFFDEELTKISIGANALLNAIALRNV
jgi:hypothetical protein